MMAERKRYKSKEIRFHEHPGRPAPGQEVHPFLKWTDKEVHLFLHPGQVKAMLSEKKNILVTAGTQSGKTIFGPWWLFREIKRSARDREENDYLAVTASFNLFKKKFLPSLIHTFVTVTGEGRYHPGDQIIELRDLEGRFWAEKNGDPMYARIILASAKAGSSKEEAGVRQLESGTYKAILADEIGLADFTLTAWEAMDRRRHVKKSRLLGMTTLYNFGWLRKKLYIPWSQGSPEIEFIQFDSTENPAFPEEEFERVRAEMPAWKFDMMYRGRFTKPAGQIFESFDETVHVLPGIPDRQGNYGRVVPSTWPVVIGLDPGGGVNTAIIWIATNPDGRQSYIFREDIWGDQTTVEMAEKVKLQAGQHLRVRAFGGAKSEKQFRKDWTAAGMTVLEPKIADVESGLDRINEQFRIGRLFITEACPLTIAQITEYARALDASGEPTTKIQNKEQYHFVDALRYAVPALPRDTPFGLPKDGLVHIPVPGLQGTDRPPPRGWERLGRRKRSPSGTVKIDIPTF